MIKEGKLNVVFFPDDSLFRAGGLGHPPFPSFPQYMHLLEFLES